jgi:hypothetical protein
MMRALTAWVCLFFCAFVWAFDDHSAALPLFGCEIAQKHEIKLHRWDMPVAGVEQGFNQLHLRLVISPSGEVIGARASGGPKELRFWPQIRDRVYQWRFTPFEVEGKPAKVEVEEFVNLVPAERPPLRHVAPPVVRDDSTVSVTLERTGCFGSCPSYIVTVSTEGIEFDGRSYVVATGKHADRVDAGKVRELARKFVASDFYSMDDQYRGLVTDNPTKVLSISIDGSRKRVVDYVGSWVGMPAVISDLEDEVDSLARTDRWVRGSEGLVAALRAEHFNFESPEAEPMLREAARLGQTATVRELIEAGVTENGPRKLTPDELNKAFPPDPGWLTPASDHPAMVRIRTPISVRHRSLIHPEE